MHIYIYIFFLFNFNKKDTSAAKRKSSLKALLFADTEKRVRVFFFILTDVSFQRLVSNKFPNAYKISHIVQQIIYNIFL